VRGRRYRRLRHRRTRVRAISRYAEFSAIDRFGSIDRRRRAAAVRLACGRQGDVGRFGQRIVALRPVCTVSNAKREQRVEAMRCQIGRRRLPEQETPGCCLGVDDPIEQIESIAENRRTRNSSHSGCRRLPHSRWRRPRHDCRAPHVASITDTSGAGDAFTAPIWQPGCGAGFCGRMPARSGLAGGIARWLAANAGAVVTKISVSHPVIAQAHELSAHVDP